MVALKLLRLRLTKNVADDEISGEGVKLLGVVVSC